MNVVWTRTAQRHLRSIHDYFALDSRQHALRFVDRITRYSSVLTTQPFLGAEVPEYRDSSLRELLYGQYRLI